MSAKRFGYRRSRNVGRVRSLDEELPERGDVDDAERLVHRPDLALGMVAVRVRALPATRPHHPRARLLVPEVERRALCRLVVAPGEKAQLDRRPRRAGGRRTELGLVGVHLLRVEPDARELAELPLAGPIVTVVYRFASSIESNPSAIARFTSFVVTSSQMQTKHFP